MQPPNTEGSSHSPNAVAALRAQRAATVALSDDGPECTLPNCVFPYKIVCSISIVHGSQHLPHNPTFPEVVRALFSGSAAPSIYGGCIIFARHCMKHLHRHLPSYSSTPINRSLVKSCAVRVAACGPANTAPTMSIEM